MKHLSQDDLVLQFYGEAGTKFERHLRECAECRTRFGSLKQVLETIQPPKEMPHAREANRREERFQVEVQQYLPAGVWSGICQRRAARDEAVRRRLDGQLRQDLFEERRSRAWQSDNENRIRVLDASPHTRGEELCGAYLDLLAVKRVKRFVAQCAEKQDRFTGLRSDGKTYRAPEGS